MWGFLWDSGCHNYIVIENNTWGKLRKRGQPLLTQTWFKLLSLRHVCFSLSRLSFTLNWNFAIWKQRHAKVASLTSTRANFYRGAMLGSLLPCSTSLWTVTMSVKLQTKLIIDVTAVKEGGGKKRRNIKLWNETVIANLYWINRK